MCVEKTTKNITKKAVQMITRIRGRVISGGKESVGSVWFDDKITAVGEGDFPFDREIVTDGYICAGFTDAHCHGGGGADFSDGNAEAVITAANVHLRHGTTSVFPTLMSMSAKETENCLSAIEEAREFAPNLRGAHLEGPYLSPEMCGAQKGGVLRAPDPAEYGKIIADYDVARWDYAPELDDGNVFLGALAHAGIIPAAAHTAATCERTLEAEKRGLDIITHLYSCTSTITRKGGFRTAGVTEAAYLSDGLVSELIADGKHLPAELIRLAFKLIGADRLMLVTDSMRAAGTNLTESYIGKIGEGVKCVIEDGVAKLPDRSAFAGSVATADVLVGTCVNAGIPLAAAIKAVTETPARVMRLRGKGKLEAGYDADIVVLGRNLTVEKVYVGGKEV